MVVEFVAPGFWGRRVTMDPSLTPHQTHLRPGASRPGGATVLTLDEGVWSALSGPRGWMSRNQTAPIGADPCGADPTDFEASARHHATLGLCSLSPHAPSRDLRSQQPHAATRLDTRGPGSVAPGRVPGLASVGERRAPRVMGEEARRRCRIRANRKVTGNDIHRSRG